MSELNVNVNSAVKLRGEYSIEVKDTLTGKKVEEKSFAVKNTVVDQGRDWLATNNNVSFRPPGATTYGLFDVTFYGRFSTGTGVITNAHTTLDGTLSVYKSASTGASTTLKLPTVDNLDGTFTYGEERAYVFSPGELTGTWGQVGIQRGTQNTQLFAGQQLKDGLGNATTLTVSATEEVTLKYRVYITFLKDIDVTLIPDANSPDISMFPVLNTSTHTINGQQTTVNIRGTRSFIDPNFFDPGSGYAAYTAAISVPNSNYIDDLAVMIDDGLGNYTREINSNVDGSTSTPSYPPKIVTPITYGSVYKYTQEFTVPYELFENKLIKAVAGHNTSFTRIYDGYNCLGFVEFDPPINKGVGNEIRIKFSMTFSFA